MSEDFKLKISEIKDIIKEYTKLMNLIIQTDKDLSQICLKKNQNKSFEIFSFDIGLSLFFNEKNYKHGDIIELYGELLTKIENYESKFYKISDEIFTITSSFNIELINLYIEFVSSKLEWLRITIKIMNFDMYLCQKVKDENISFEITEKFTEFINYYSRKIRDSLNLYYSLVRPENNDELLKLTNIQDPTFTNSQKLYVIEIINSLKNFNNSLTVVSKTHDVENDDEPEQNAQDPYDLRGWNDNEPKDDDNNEPKDDDNETSQLILSDSDKIHNFLKIVESYESNPNVDFYNFLMSENPVKTSKLFEYYTKYIQAQKIITNVSSSTTSKRKRDFSDIEILNMKLFQISEDIVYFKEYLYDFINDNNKHYLFEDIQYKIQMKLSQLERQKTKIQQQISEFDNKSLVVEFNQSEILFTRPEEDKEEEDKDVEIPNEICLLSDLKHSNTNGDGNKIEYVQNERCRHIYRKNYYDFRKELMENGGGYDQETGYCPCGQILNAYIIELFPLSDEKSKRIKL